MVELEETLRIHLDCQAQYHTQNAEGENKNEAIHGKYRPPCSLPLFTT